MGDNGEFADRGQNLLGLPPGQCLRQMHGASLGAHQLLLLQRCLPLRSTVCCQSGLADIGICVAGREDKHTQSVLEMLDADGVEEAADSIYPALAGRAE